MKKLIFVSLLLLGFNSIALAADKYQNVNLKICLINIKAVKIFTDQQCQKQLQPCYTVHIKAKKIKLNEEQNFILTKFKAETGKNGITIVEGKGLWTGEHSAVDNKPFKDKTYFKGVGFDNAGSIKGIFTDSICRGEFEATIIK